jgi:hypothetical protein
MVSLFAMAAIAVIVLVLVFLVIRNARILFRGYPEGGILAGLRKKRQPEDPKNPSPPKGKVLRFRRLRRPK